MVRISFLVILIGVFWQCRSKENSADAMPPPSGKDGAELAQIYCGSCHTYTAPDLMPRQVWMNKVLPNMATRMGLPMGFPYQNLSPEDMQAVIRARVIPETPMLHMEDMQKIVKFYADNAPASPAPQQRAIEPTADLGYFNVKKKKIPVKSTQNMLLHPLPDGGGLVLSFEDKGSFLYNPKTDTYTPIAANITASDARVAANRLFLLHLGTTQAYNLPNGRLEAVDMTDPSQRSVVIDSLIRPVSMDMADLNADGQPDFVICEFGDYLGRLTLHLSKTGGGFERIVLKDYPGACKAIIRDMNQDGLPDIAVLMSQGREELLVYMNEGQQGRSFREQSVARFPPSYGSNALEVADINQDGAPDLLMTNGDNADLSQSLKAYHGVRVYVNDGKGQCNLAWFYPMHGASGLQIADFDQDGQQDIAVIAHFPDFKSKRPEDFILFKKKPNAVDFEPHIFRVPLKGRLLTMAHNDIDRDGDEDLMIGNFIDVLSDPGTWYADWSKEQASWWILENKR
jgi:hypothetical protein